MNKVFLIAGALVLIPVFASAQEKEVSITVNQQELQLIGKALGLMPYGDVAPLFAKLQQQIAKQTAPVQPSVKEEKKND